MRPKDFELAVAKKLGWDHNVTRQRIYRYKREGVIPDRRSTEGDIEKTARLLDIVRVVDIRRVNKKKLWEGEIEYAGMVYNKFGSSHRREN